MTANGEPNRRTAVLYDQHPVFAEGLREVLRRVGFDVIGSTTSPERALSIVLEREPDLLITEIQTADGAMDGIALLREARSQVPGLKAIVVTAFDHPACIASAFDAGAVGYVVKTVNSDDLAAAVRQAFEHSVYLSGGAVSMAPLRQEAMEETQVLTRRELEILQLVAEGYSNGELAKMLWVAEQTVKFHLSNVYRKLDVANRTEAGRWAQRHGLLARGSTAPKPGNMTSVSPLRPRRLGTAV